MQEPGAPEAVDVSTPPRQGDGCYRLLSLPRCTNTNAKGAEEGDTCGTGSSSDMEDSPHLPDNWLLLEYEVLEYADVLPRDLTDRMRCELEAQEERVAQLRGLNEILRVALCNRPGRLLGETTPTLIALTSEALPVSIPTTPTNKGTIIPMSPKLAISNASCRNPSRVSGNTKSNGAKASSAVTISQLNPPFRENARELVGKVRQVRKSTQRELLKLAKRAKAAEERQRQFAHDASENTLNRRQLWEAETELLRLRCRVPHLENARWHTERRANQHDNAEKQFALDLEYLQTEVHKFRAHKPKFDALEKREEELKHALRKAKMALKATQWRQGQWCR